MIQALLFDLGGVILRTQDKSPRRRWEQRLGLQDGELEQLVFTNPLSLRAALGQADAVEVWADVGRQLSLNSDDLSKLEHDFWLGDAYDFNLLNFIRSLRPQFKTGLITNSWPSMRRSAQKYINSETFDLIIYSDEVGLAKPDAEIYLYALRQLHVLDATHVVFVDDALINVRGAQAIGMLGIHFKNPNQLYLEVDDLLHT